MLITNKLKSYINPLTFGNFVIKNNGEIYADINGEVIGDIKNSGLNSLLKKSLLSNKNWLNVRNNFKPCKSCLFNAICPPISGYEHVIGKPNLCTINYE